MFIFIDLWYLLILSKWIVQGAAFRTANGKDYIYSANFGIIINAFTNPNCLCSNCLDL